MSPRKEWHQKYNHQGLEWLAKVACKPVYWSLYCPIQSMPTSSHRLHLIHQLLEYRDQVMQLFSTPINKEPHRQFSTFVASNGSFQQIIFSLEHKIRITKHANISKLSWTLLATIQYVTSHIMQVDNHAIASQLLCQ